MHVYVCLLAWPFDGPLTVNFKWAHSNISRRSIAMKHVKPVEGYCQSVAPRTKITEVEACVVLVCASTDDGRLLTGGTNLIWTVVEWSDFTPCTHLYEGMVEVLQIHMPSQMLHGHTWRPLLLLDTVSPPPFLHTVWINIQWRGNCSGRSGFGRYTF